MSPSAGTHHYICKASLLVNAPFGIVHYSHSLFWCEAMIRVEVLENAFCLFRSKIHVVEESHSFQRLLPTFRTSPFPGKASHVAPVVAWVAASALFFYKWICNRNAFLAMRDLGRNLSQERSRH